MTCDAANQNLLQYTKFSSKMQSSMDFRLKKQHNNDLWKAACLAFLISDKIACFIVLMID
ncbi:hypothetical protein T4D_14808 [Trichinella pseudospiralis]|uniref:Uncharacterized protein n=1 Tax=Trichinella pseudospiralis TaxID=6337 RepID=A0A0V1FK63_TRIPS|nr:hypothetical protein T4D_14808 [Trichinella pseudospiralis]